MYELLKKDGRAKRGRLHTVHGDIETPVFMNVGTAAAIKGAVSTADLQQIGTQVELSNTYHLHVRPGDQVVKKMGGCLLYTSQQLKGIPAAVTAGIIAGSAEKELEVIAEVSEEQIREMKRYLEQTPITVKPLNSGITFDLIIKAYKGTSYSKIRIANYHTNVVLVEKDHNICLLYTSLSWQSVWQKAMKKLRSVWLRRIFVW